MVIAAGFVAIAALAVAMYLRTARADGDVGITTEFATLITYGLGVIAGRGELALSVAAAVITVALLDVKAPLHDLVRRIRHDEVKAAIKLLVVPAVLLPILPDQGYGPGGTLNPYRAG